MFCATNRTVLSRQVLDCLNAAVVVLDTDGRVRFANRSAKKLPAPARQPAVAPPERPQVVRKEHASWIGETIARARSCEADEEAILHVRSDCAQPLAVLALRSPRAPRPTAGYEPEFVLLVADGERPACAEAAALYGLTPAECLTLEALLSGRGLKQASKQRGVSMNTAKVQLAKILEKTGARDQVDLIRIVLGGVGLLRFD
jgi:DNA-binding CsgD family transcriptional regulator